MMNKLYKGFSTRDYENSGTSFEIYDIDCINQDLLNNIFTIKGERVNMPDEGTRIPLMMFELNDKASHNVIQEDIETVIDNDPRVKLLSIDIVPLEDRNSVVAVARVRYLEFNVVKDLRIEISSK